MFLKPIKHESEWKVDNVDTTKQRFSVAFALSTNACSRSREFIQQRPVKRT